MKIDNNDNLIVTGQRGSCGRRHPVCLNGEFWLMKFINDSPDWFLIEGSSTDDIPLSLVIDSSNNIYIHGKTKGSLYAYSSSIPGEWDGFLSKYDTNGNFHWKTNIFNKFQ